MTMTRKTITIPEAMEDWVKAQISDGRYASDSEYFRDLIRRDQERRQNEMKLRQLLDNAEESGFSDRTVQDIMAAVEENMREAGRVPPNI